MKEQFKEVVKHIKTLKILNKECLELIDYMEESEEDELRENLSELRKLLDREREILNN